MTTQQDRPFFDPQEARELLARVTDMVAYVNDCPPGVEPVFRVFRCTSCGHVLVRLPLHPARRECTNCHATELDDLGQTPPGWGWKIAAWVRETVRRHEKGINVLPKQLYLPVNYRR